MSIEPKSFLPQFSCIGVIGGAIALYKMFEEDTYKQICDRQTRRAIVFPSNSDAIKAAKAHVLRICNPHIRAQAEVSPEVEDDPDILAIKEWEEKRRDEYAQAKIMGRRSTMRPVIVERVKRRGKR